MRMRTSLDPKSLPKRLETDNEAPILRCYVVLADVPGFS